MSEGTMTRFGACAMALVAVLSGAGISTHAANLAGPQIFDCKYWQTVHIGDFYGPNYNLRNFQPIRMTGCRNGTFSGQVVVESGVGAVRNLKATMSDLVSKGGQKIPAGSTRVRYAQLGGSYMPSFRFNALLDEAPEEVKIVDIRKSGKWEAKNPGPVSMQPIWVTVSVPKDAAPGEYTGTLTVQAKEMEPFPVTVKISVHGWTLADPREYKVQNPAYYAVEPIAWRYKADKWSDRHFNLMGQSMGLMLPLGSRQLTLDLVRKYPSRDNDESMIRWVKQADGSYKYDFTIVEKFFDLAAKVIGKPFPLRLNIFYATKDWSLPAQVTTVDPATGKLGTLKTPKPGTPENEAFWKPVLTELRKRIEQRGWFDSTVVNWINYCGGPDASIMRVVHNIWPDARWSSMDHGRRYYFKLDDDKRVPVQAHTTVWNEGTLRAYHKWDRKSSPGPRGTRGRLKEGFSFCGHARGQHRDWHALWVPRTICELLLMKGNHGVDPLGADLWPMPDHRGRMRCRTWRAYALGPQNSALAYLAPGKDGPVATERYEAFREGVQICEVLVYLQRAADSGKLGPELTAKANKALDDRARHYMEAYEQYKSGRSMRWRLNYAKFTPRAFQIEDQLFSAAAEVEKATAK